MNLILRQLTEQDEKAFFEGMNEWSKEDRDWYTFSWKDGMSYADMLTILGKERRGIELAPGRVAHTMLYGFVDGKIIGRVSVRHELNDHLRKRGGHIGYSVAEKYRRKGYASEMVSQALDYCRSLGLKKLMVSCADDNTGSWKIIENFGGELEERIWDAEEEETIRKYWIDLSKS